jgi:tryptophan synthase alpha chain
MLRVRSRLPDLPLVIMIYSNILLKAGFKNFMAKSKWSGMDGFILPDMRPDESYLYVKEASRLGQGFAACL